MRFISKARILSGVLTLSLGFAVLPADATMSVDPEVHIDINGKLLQFPAGDQPPIIVDDRTYVPLRIISENLGAEVDWIESTRQVVINRTNKEYIPNWAGKDGEIEIIIDGKTLVIPEGFGRAFIEQSRTMIPLRVVSEALGCNVDWEEDTRTAVITGTTEVPETSNPGTDPEIPSSTVDTQLFEKLAEYKTNLKLMDGKVINSADLLNMDESEFSEAQLDRFESYLEELDNYPLEFSLPDGEVINPETISIFGESQLTAEQMEDYLAGEAPRIEAKMESMGREFNPMPELAELYLEIGEDYGIRGDIAYFQAVKETGYFQFTGSVQPWQNNYCGLWATGSPCTGAESLNGANPDDVRFESGVHGAIFATPEAGVEAHIQHLYAYATKKALPEGKVLIDPRYALVSRGIAPTWMQLNARWAVPGTTYGQSILYDYWAKAF